jgi:phosphoglycerate dehydrogenase-like enzyme
VTYQGDIRRKHAGAALEVLENEPDLPEDGLHEVPCHPHFGQRCTPEARRLSAALMMKSTAFSEGMALISPLFQA